MNISTKPLKCKFVKFEMKDVFIEGLIFRDNILSVPLVLGVRILAGTVLEFDVIFKPIRSDDLEGRLVFFTEEKQFKIPFRCLVERAKPVIEPNILDFGNILAETSIRKSISIQNIGTLPCTFYITQSFRALSETDATEENYSNETDDRKVPGVLEKSLGEEKAPAGNDEIVQNIVEEIFDNIFEVYQFSKKYYLRLEPRSALPLKVKFYPPTAGIYRKEFKVIFDCKYAKEVSCSNVPVFSY